MRHFLWNDHAELLTQPLAGALMEMRRADGGNDLLMDAVSLWELTECADQVLAIDGVVVPYQRLEKVAGQIELVMKRASGTVKPVARQITDPFIQLAVLQVAVIYELSDGQTATIYFHNPDSTPKKIKPTDELVSWKWLLNKKDVTILVAPEQGKELDPREVARRVMKAAEKNSAAFVRNNAKRAERMAVIDGLKGEITGLEGECKDLEKQIAVARIAAEDAAQVEPVAPEPEVVDPEPVIEPEPVVEPDPQPVTLTGTELGEFPETPEGKKALRAVAKKTYEDLIEAGKWVPCPDLGSPVELRTQGKKKVISTSIDTRKLKIIPRLKDLIFSAKKIGEEKPNYDIANSPNIAGYQTMRARVVLGEDELAVRFVVGRDDKGAYHYDHTIHASEVVFDSANENGPTEVDPLVSMGGSRGCTRDRSAAPEPCRLLSAEPSAEHQDELILDQSGENVNTEVFNLFIEGEEPEAVEPDQTNTETPDIAAIWDGMSKTERARVLTELGYRTKTGRPNVQAKRFAEKAWADLPLSEMGGAEQRLTAVLTGGDTAPEPPPEPVAVVEPEPTVADPTPDEPDTAAIARVDAAYRFDSATDEFKEWMAESLDKPSYSPFVTARAMDQRAKAHGAAIEWGLFGGAELDSVHEDDISLDSTWQDQPRDRKTGRWVLRRAKRIKRALKKAQSALSRAASGMGDYVSRALAGGSGEALKGSGDGIQDLGSMAAPMDPGAAAIGELLGGIGKVKALFDSAEMETEYAADLIETVYLDAAKRPKFNPKTDRWISTESGSHLMIRGNKVVGGAGGKLKGQELTGRKARGSLGGHKLKDLIEEIDSRGLTTDKLKSIRGASKEDIAALEERDVDELFNALDLSRYSDDADILIAKRSGNDKLIALAEKNRIAHVSAIGSMAKTRNAKLQTAANISAAIRTAASGKEKIDEGIKDSEKWLQRFGKDKSGLSKLHQANIKTLKKVRALLDSALDSSAVDALYDILFESEVGDDVTLDSTTFDDANEDGSEYVGKLTKDGELLARVDFGDDGKAMVYLGASGGERVKTPDGGEAWYSDDDAPDMVDWVFAGASLEPEAVEALDPDPTLPGDNNHEQDEQDYLNHLLGLAENRHGVIRHDRINVYNPDGPHYGVEGFNFGDEISTTKRAIDLQIREGRYTRHLPSKKIDAYPISSSEASLLADRDGPTNGALRPFLHEGIWWLDAPTVILAMHGRTAHLSPAQIEALKVIDRRTAEVFPLNLDQQPAEQAGEVEPEPVIEPLVVNGNTYTEIRLDDQGARAAMAEAVERNSGDLFEAAKDVYKNTLQGRYVKTEIGNVLITGGGWQEMKRGLNRDAVRARTIPFIPVILADGDAGKEQGLDKIRTDGSVGFYPFTKTVDLGDVTVKALLKVAKREDHTLVYHLKSDVTLDSAQKQNPPLSGSVRDEGFRGSGVPSEPTTKPESTPSPLLTVDSSVGEDGAEINLIILKVIDNVTGERLADWEDGADGSVEPETDWRAIADAFGADKPGYAGTRSFESVAVIVTLASGAWVFSREPTVGFVASFSIGNGKYSSGDMVSTPQEAYESMRKNRFYAALGFDADELTPEGAENSVKTAKGTKVDTGFTVIEATRLVASHDSNGDPNPDYPADLQPRDRGRKASIAWVRKTANHLDPDSLGKTRRADTGAPIVGKDRVVESGNGRTMAIQEAYRSGKAEEYREWLIEEAASFGLDPDKIRAMKAPVLVRVRTSELNRREFAIEANQDDKLSMTGTEKARADADRLDSALLSKLADHGDLLSAANRGFISGFLASLGDAESAQYITSNGQPTGALIARVQSAVFAKAYSDDRLLELTADASKPEVANVISALNASANEFIRAQEADKAGTDALTVQVANSIEVSLNQQTINTLIDATNLVRKAKSEGQSVDEVVAQMGLFENIPPATAAMAIFINKNNRSAKRLGVAFTAMARYLRLEAERGQTVDMFGESAKASLEDIIKAANRDLEREYGEGAFAIDELDLFGLKAVEPVVVPVVEPEPEPTKGRMGLEDVLRVATTPGRDGNSAFHVYRKVDDAEASKIKQATGMDVSGFEHGIDEAAIRHALNQHGDVETENARGQVAITQEDLKLIADLTDPAQADSVESGEISREGLETIVYKKRINGFIVVVEEVREGRQRLAFKTMWKIRSAPRGTSEEAAALPSETFGAQSSTGSESIGVELDPGNLVAPAESSQAIADRALFQSVIDGSVENILSPELSDDLIAAYERNMADPELTAMAEAAMDEYERVTLATEVV